MEDVLEMVSLRQLTVKDLYDRYHVILKCSGKRADALIDHGASDKNFCWLVLGTDDCAVMPWKEYGKSWVCYGRNLEEETHVDHTAKRKTVVR